MIEGLNLGKRLKELRLSRHLKQSDVAKALYVTNALISAIELEQRQPSIEMLIKLCNFYHVSADYLLNLKPSNTFDLDGLTSEEVKSIQTIVKSLKSKTGHH